MISKLKCGYWNYYWLGLCVGKRVEFKYFLIVDIVTLISKLMLTDKKNYKEYRHLSREVSMEGLTLKIHGSNNRMYPNNKKCPNNKKYTYLVWRAPTMKTHLCVKPLAKLFQVFFCFLPDLFFTVTFNIHCLKLFRVF